MVLVPAFARFSAWLASRDAAAWVVSFGTHAGVLGALAVGWTTFRPPAPTLSGQRSVASLRAVLSMPQPDWQIKELDLGEIQVVVRPDRAEVANQHFEPATTEVEIGTMEVELAPHEPVERPPTEADQPVADRPPAEQVAPAASRPSSPSMASAASQQSAGYDTAPRPLSNPPPQYPEPARQAGWEGTVILRLTVAVDGAVGTIEIAESSGYEILDAAAVRAVRVWHFAPAMAGGRAAEWIGKLPVRFSLSSAP